MNNFLFHGQITAPLVRQRVPMGGKTSFFFSFKLLQWSVSCCRSAEAEVLKAIEGSIQMVLRANVFHEQSMSRSHWSSPKENVRFQLQETVITFHPLLSFYFRCCLGFNSFKSKHFALSTGFVIYFDLCLLESLQCQESFYVLTCTFCFYLFSGVNWREMWWKYSPKYDEFLKAYFGT